jgi:uncharacterized delta-60 repeat protein
MYAMYGRLSLGFLTAATLFSVSRCAAAAPGDLDTTFGTGGKVLIGVGTGQNDLTRAMTIDSAGNIYVAGIAASTTSNDFAVIRLLPSGQLDSTFGTGGKKVVDIGTNTNDRAIAMTLDSTGNVYLAGVTDLNTRDQFTVVRLTKAGAIDLLFGASGHALVDNPTTSNDSCCAIALESDGSIFLTGSTVLQGKQNLKLAKLTSAGDATGFGGVGYATANFNGNSTTTVAIIPDVSGDLNLAGTVAASGNIDMALIRFDSSGALETGFHSGGASYADISSLDLSAAMVRDKSGNFYIVGRAGSPMTGIGIAKFDKLGTLVDDFGTNGVEQLVLPGKTVAYANDLKIDGDGNLYIAATTNGTSTTITPAIVAVDGQTGALISGFGTDGLATADVPAVNYAGDAVILDPARNRVCIASERGDLQTPAKFAVACFIASPVNEIFAAGFEP